MSTFNMLSVSQCTPALPGFAMPKTYAAWPVWSGSTTKEIRFQPMPKKAATRLWHRARDFDRQTRQAGKHGGVVGHSALQVLHAMLFDFLNYTSGRLDPSYAAIARKANVCQRTVANAVKRLRDLGILNWVRRCTESRKEGSAHDLSKIARQAEMSVLSAVYATFVCGRNRQKRQNHATFLSKRCLQNASERQRNFEQAVSVRFWTNRVATPPSAAWGQMSAI